MKTFQQIYESVVEEHNVRNEALQSIVDDFNEQKKEAEEEEREFDADRFIFSLHSSDLEEAFPVIYNDYFENPETVNSTVYHRTDAKNIDSIIREGLKSMNVTRGVTNRSVGKAIFASAENDEMGTYGDALVEINLGQARKLGIIETSLEPAVENETRIKTLASVLNVDDMGQFDVSSSYGETPDTLIIRGNISPKAIRVSDKKGDIVFTGENFE